MQPPIQITPEVRQSLIDDVKNELLKELAVNIRDDDSTQLFSNDSILSLKMLFSRFDEIKLLLAFGEKDIISPTELKEYFSMSPSSLFRYLKKLEKMGIIEKVDRGQYQLAKGFQPMQEIVKYLNP